MIVESSAVKAMAHGRLGMTLHPLASYPLHRKQQLTAGLCVSSDLFRHVRKP
jgi:hypothetical protein